MLGAFVDDFASALARVDSRSPVALSQRSKRSYQPGIGPHSEVDTVRLVTREMVARSPAAYAGLARGVPYGPGSRQSCDICMGPPSRWHWAVEITMLRLLGDNGKANDNMLLHILSPYAAHRSALTDCEKLLSSDLADRKAVVIYGYD